MKKSMIALVMMGAMAALAGCNDTSSPTAVVMTAAKNLRGNNFKGFRSTLTGDALAQYGTIAGAAELQKTLTPDAAIGRIDLLTRSEDRMDALTRTTNRVEVLSGTRTLLNVTVACVTYYETNACGMINPNYCQPDPANRGYTCYGPVPGRTTPARIWCSDEYYQNSDRQVRSTDCRISGIELN
jgi:hypothetical protein